MTGQLTRFMRVALPLAGAAGFWWLGSCASDPTGPNPPRVPPLQERGAVLSDPVVSVGTPVRGTRASVASAVTTTVYASLPPGEAPGGSTATIRRVGDVALVTTAVVNGGFDPVPVSAQPGDQIEVTVTNLGGAVLMRQQVTVKPSRPPVIVRTNPPHHVTDVSVNALLVIVFSEPVNENTLNSSSVQLFRGTSQVAGTVSLQPGSATTVEFAPTSPLAASTIYRLKVGTGVRDLDGDALQQDTTVQFTTGTAMLGPVSLVLLDPTSVSDTGFYVAVGSQIQMRATALDAQRDTVEGHPITWASSDPSVAVSPTGLVTAVAAGDAHVTATVDGVTGQIRLRPVSQQVPVRSVTITPDSARVDVGGSAFLATAMRDSTGAWTYARLTTWSSSDPAVATVASYGDAASVQGVAPGVAAIVVTVEGVSDTAFVEVGPMNPTGITVSANKTTMVLGDTIRMAASSRDARGFSMPLDATQVAWSSSNRLVASVTNEGLVIGVGAGTATITAGWGGFTASVTVTVVSLSFTSVAVGGYVVCGLATTGATYCWASLPYPVAAGHTFESVAAGGNFACGLATDGTAWCWGTNYRGELGDGTLQDSPLTPVAGGRTYTRISAGDEHTCAITLAGDAYCWGANSAGQLGDGSTQDRWAPVAVAGGLQFAAISAGLSHTCALTVGGAAFCWGANQAGQLGTGDQVNYSTPQPVVGGLAFNAISVAGQHTCALTSNGTAYCWGDYLSATPIQAAGGTGLAALSSGVYATCGLDAAGVALCWSSGAWRGSPWQVPGGPFAGVSAGYNRQCFVTPGQVAYCQGFAPLGDGTLFNSNVPVKVGGQP